MTRVQFSPVFPPLPANTTIPSSISRSPFHCHRASPALQAHSTSFSELDASVFPSLFKRVLLQTLITKQLIFFLFCRLRSLLQVWELFKAQLSGAVHSLCPEISKPLLTLFPRRNLQAINTNHGKPPSLPPIAVIQSPVSPILAQGRVSSLVKLNFRFSLIITHH